MPRYKRNAAEAELDLSGLEEPIQRDTVHTETLTKLRNMWEFASLMQYIYLFGSVVKIDEEFDIEDLEHECIQSEPTGVLAAIGLALLKYVSSHRGLTPQIFTEYTRRQYLAKLPSQNPFGDDEDPMPFNDLDIFTRIRVLQQLSTWTFGNSERIRGLMPEGEDDLTWRMEPLGWDTDDRAYFVLDDNRLYRRTDEPPPPPTPQFKPKSKSANKKNAKQPAAKQNKGTRTSKRRRVDDSPEAEDEEETEEIEAAEDTVMANGDDTVEQTTEESGYGFTSKTWECIAITLAEYQDFLSTIQRSRDANEKILRRRIEEDVLPILEKRAEAIRQKQLKKIRELETMQKMTTAKRSSRLADKADQQAKKDEERQAELRKVADLRMAHEEQEKSKRIEEGHESRRLTREQRLKEREVKRILHEEELARLEREASTAGSQQESLEAVDPGATERKRLSSRNLLSQQEAHRKELERLTQDQEEDKWYFDCVVCGMHGENLDDGSHSVACERCNVWQHSRCHGFTPEQCEDKDFHFVCNSCKKKERADREPKSGIILKLGKQNGSPSSVKIEANDTIAVAPHKKEPLPDFVQRQLDGPAHQRGPAPAMQHPQASQQGHLYQHPAQQGQLHQHPAQQGQLHQHPTQQGQLHQHPAQQGQLHQHPAQQGQLHQHPAQQGQLYHHPTQQSMAAHTAQPAQHGQPYQRSSQQDMTTQQSPPQRALPQQPTPIPNAARAAYQPPLPQQMQSAQAYPPRGFAGTPPQRTQASPGSAAKVPIPNIAQHNWMHSSAVNGSIMHSQMPRAPLPAHPATQNQILQPPSHQAQHARAPPGEHVFNGTPQLAQRSPQFMTQTPQAQHPASGILSSSPHTSIPPPSTAYNREAAISPMKSSPPRPVAPSPSAQMINGNATGSFAAISTHTASPSASFDNAPKLATPLKAGEIPVPSSHITSDVAANGMKGPWPEGSLGVPHKHESPAAQ